MIDFKDSNPFTGYHTPGMRFRLNCRGISRCPLYLPLGMKNHPQVMSLKSGVSPLEVFGVSTIGEARRAFHHLREQFDFSFWAVRNYKVRDINDPDKIVPYIIPEKLALMVHIIQMRYHKQLLGRYVITKEYGKIGLTTCLQAYVLWRQLRSQRKGHAVIFGSSTYTLNPLKDNLCRNIGRCPTSAKRIRFPPQIGSYPDPAWGSVIFNSLKNPDGVRGIDIDYALFTDMSKWRDKKRINSDRAQGVCLGTVLLDYQTLFIMEGDRPTDFPESLSELTAYRERKVYNARTKPSLLLEVATYSSLHHRTAPYFHIKI